MRVKITFLVSLCFFLSWNANSQVFWFENWTGCTCAQLCTTYTGPNGAWTTVATGANGAAANLWYYSYEEQGMGRTKCGSATGTRATAHIGNVSTSPAASFFCPTGDCGAAYDASSGSPSVVTATRIQSPVINCTGESSITLSFNYIMNGEAGHDYGTVWYYNGTTWALLASPAATAVCGSGQGKWTYYSVALPASANNNPAVQIGFNWQNDANNSGNDPSFAIDSISLSVPTVSVKPVADFTANDSTICAGQSVTFTDKSTGSPTSWKWTFAGGTPGTSILQNPVVVYNTPGTYLVKEVVTNGAGSDSLTKNNYIVVNPLPTVTLSGTTSICNGSPTSLTATGGGTYSWSTGATTSNITVSPVVTTTYTVGVTNLGCTKDTNVVVTVNPIPTLTVTPSAPTVCSGGSINLTASGASTYTWTPATGLSCTTCSNPIASPTVTTTYTIDGTSAAGCTGTTTVVVTVGGSVVAGITGKDTVCAGSSTVLTATGGSSFKWSTGVTTSSITVSPATTTTYSVVVSSGTCKDSTSQKVVVNPLPTITFSGNAPICPGGTDAVTATGGGTYAWSTGQTTSSINVTPAATTTYTIGVTNNGCTKDSDVVVTVDPTPTVTVTPAAPTICTSGSVVLNGNGALTYSWVPATGLSCTNCTSPTASPTVTTTYTVTGANGAGCTGTSTVVVTVVPAVTATVTATKDTVCAGGATTLTASGGTTFAWSTGASTSSITVNPASTITYSVTVSSGTCSDGASIVITVNPSPVISISGNTSICAGDSTTLTASGGVTYAWSTGATTTNVNVKPGATTTYTVVASNGTCVADTTVVVNVTPKPTVTITGNTKVCAGSATTLTASGGTGYLWNTGATTSAITVTPNSTDTYSVDVTSGPCKVQDTVIVSVNSGPIATACCNATIDLGGDTVITVTTGAASTFAWAPGTGLSCITCPQPTASPSVTTTYVVTITSDSTGCSTRDTVTISVLDNCGQTFVPNAFSPNGDGVNDVLYVYGNCITSMTFEIYDRWGNKVFESTDVSMGWDGKYNGQEMNTGIYVYHLVATLINNTTINQKGNINLVR